MAYAQNTSQSIEQNSTKNISTSTTKNRANDELIKNTHLVERGDTLWLISQRYYGRAMRWSDISFDNQILKPKLLKPGTLLLLRSGSLRLPNTATVMAVTGDVRLLTPMESIATVKTASTVSKRISSKSSDKITLTSVLTFVSGDLINKGDLIPVGATLKTGSDSFITLLMPNGSRATLPSNSQMKLVSFKDEKGNDAVLLDLVDGQVDARVQHSDDANGKPSYRIRTKLATIGARGTYFRVTLSNAQFSGTQRTLVGVLEGIVAANWGIEKSLSDGTNSSSKAGRASAALLMAGQGSMLQLGMEPKQAFVETLLPAPVLQEANASQNQSDVVVRWLSVTGAAAYRVQLARDVDFVDVFAQQEVAANSDLQYGSQEMATGMSVASPASTVYSKNDTYKAWFSQVAQGSYFVRVSAIATNGLEGLFALSGFTRPGYAMSGTVTLLGNGEGLEFSWTALPSSNYSLEVADNKEFTSVRLRVPNLLSNTVRVAALPPGNYFWRVRADVQEHGQTTKVMSDTLQMLVGGVR
jgi:hypothetical protein